MDRDQRQVEQSALLGDLHIQQVASDANDKDLSRVGLIYANCYNLLEARSDGYCRAGS